jgi:hypothetical protein
MAATDVLPKIAGWLYGKGEITDDDQRRNDYESNRPK